MLLDMLEDGRLHLSGIARLASHLTVENRETVLDRAVHKSKREIEELIAELAPKPDVPATVRKLPERTAKPSAASAPSQLVPERVTNRNTPPTLASAGTPSPSASPLPVRKAPKVEPLAPARYKFQFTGSAELKDKLERLQALMRTQVPDGDLAVILEDLVTERLSKLEAKRYAATQSPRKTLEQTETTRRSRRIPAAVKRTVHARDGNRCTYVDARGRRCSEHRRLEFHHHDPYGCGGGHGVDNISLRCRAHNLHQAELDYGKKTMDAFRKAPDAAREPAPIYFNGRGSPIECGCTRRRFRAAA